MGSAERKGGVLMELVARSSRRSWLALSFGAWCLVILGGLSSGCGGRACTAIGCSDEVRVALEPAVGSSYDVELLVDGVEGSFTCSGSEAEGWSRSEVSGGLSIWGCTGRGFEIQGRPERVEAQVRAQDGSWTGSASEAPSYETFQPNGPKCSPTCHVAELSIAGEVRSICTEREPGGPLCENGEIAPIVPCCELPAPPDVADACDGSESLVNPTSCTSGGATVNYLLTQFEILDDCNLGYDLDGCFGRSCIPGGLAPPEGQDGVDNGLAGLGAILDGVDSNLVRANQWFADALCGKSNEHGEGCETDVLKIELRLAVTADAEESCAIVTVFSGADEVGTVAMNLSDGGCLSGVLPTLPLDLERPPLQLSNVTLRTTIGDQGLSQGVMGATGDEAFAASVAEVLSTGAGLLNGILDINDDLSGDPEAACNAVSGTYRIGGVAEDVGKGGS
jgi:hypothetical protein